VDKAFDLNMLSYQILKETIIKSSKACVIFGGEITNGSNPATKV